jgi:single-strand DNA-binding protein
MSGINKVILIGRLGKDPKSIDTKTGTKIVKISVATSRKWKDKQTGEMVEKTEWHRVTAFNHQANFIAKYLKKGDMVYIEGSLKTENYVDKTTGEDRWSTEVVARDVQGLSPKGDSSQSNSNDIDLNITHPGNVATHALHDDDLGFF